MFAKRWAVAAVLVLATILAMAGCGSGGADNFPNKPITYLVTFDPGGPSDREARRQQPVLEKNLGQKVVIDYRVGGGGALGWAELARAKPDGYVIAGFNLPNIIIQPMQQEVGYKTEQINPISIFQTTPLALTVLKTRPYKTLEEFIPAAKQKNGEMIFGGSGDFSAERLGCMSLEKAIGAKFKYVTFTGGAPRNTALLGGHTEVAMVGSDDLIKYKDQVSILAFAAEKRDPNFPDVPTFKEKGFNLLASIDRAVGAPPATPAPVIKKLEQAFLAIAKDKDYQATMIKEGAVPMTLGHEESKNYIKERTTIFEPLAKELLQQQKK